MRSLDVCTFSGIFNTKELIKCVKESKQKAGIPTSHAWRSAARRRWLPHLCQIGQKQDMMSQDVTLKRTECISIPGSSLGCYSSVQASKPVD